MFIELFTFPFLDLSPKTKCVEHLSHLSQEFHQIPAPPQATKPTNKKIKKQPIMASQPTPSVNVAAYENHWFRLIRPAIKTLISGGGTYTLGLGGVGGLAIINQTAPVSSIS